MLLMVWSKSDGSEWESPGRRWSRGIRVLPRVGVPWLRHGASGSIGRTLGREFFLRPSGADGREGLWDSRIRAWRALTGGFRAGSGAGVRVGLGYVQKGVPSRLYGSACPTSIEGARNLTGDLTLDLTSRLTCYLTVGLTERGGAGGGSVEQMGVRTRRRARDGALAPQPPAPA